MEEKKEVVELIVEEEEEEEVMPHDELYSIMICKLKQYMMFFSHYFIMSAVFFCVFVNTICFVLFHHININIQ